MWTCYIIVLSVVLFTFVLLIADVLAPTFYPDTDISGVKQYINTFCVILSFSSVALGAYSIWQSNGSNRQVNEILQSVRAIEREQRLSRDLMGVITSAKDNGITLETSEAKKEGKWETDTNEN